MTAPSDTGPAGPRRLPDAGGAPERAAVVGIGCRLPGGVDGPDALWALLRSGGTALGPLPQDRWAGMVDLLHEEDRPSAPWTAGALTAEEVAAFDHRFFGIDPATAERTEPLHRLLAETGVEALQDAGVTVAEAGGRTGVYTGSASVDSAAAVFGAGQRPGLLEVGGGGTGMLGTQLARFLDARGPLTTIDTACSSSLTALHYARRDLESGDVDLAIIAGVNSVSSPVVTRAFNDGGVLSDVCRPFDAKADGYVRGEGVVVVVLRRLSDARARGDRVYAVIAGSAVNSDGRSPQGLGAPSAEAQAELLADCYTRAGIDPARVGYVHAHGTGTRAGDRIEAQALHRVFARTAEDPLWVGSSKGAIGHQEGGAGVAGLAAAALAVHHGEIPPTAGHTNLRPALRRLAIRVPTEVVAWPDRGPERVAGVSSFGFGGSNAHAVLTSPPAPDRAEARGGGPERAHVLPVSAHTPEALAATAGAWAQALQRAAAREEEAGAPAGAGLRGFAATAGHRRDHHAHRAAVVAATTAEAARALRALAAGEGHACLVGPRRAAETAPRRLVWAFGGHGAQRPAMGRVLAERSPVFAAALAEVGEHLDAWGAHPSWNPLRGEPAGYAATQQAVFAFQVATARTLAAWGLTPDAVIGHSLGEVAAAHVAGALSLDQAARVIVARSRALQEVVAEGAMLATGLTEAQARERLADYPELDVAVLNGPRATVVSGPHGPLKRLAFDLASDGVWHRLLEDAPPAHSRIVRPGAERLAAELAGLEAAAPSVPMASTARHGAPAPVTDAAYWSAQLRDPVDLHAAVARTAHAGPALFVEVSPNATLATPITQILTHHALPAALSAPGALDADEHTALLHAVAACYTHGRIPAWPDRGLPHAPLPPLRWHRATAEAAPPLQEQLSGLGAAERRARLEHLARTLVAELAPVPVGPDDRDTSLEELGLTSHARLALRARLAGLDPALSRPGALDVEHTPTIAGLGASLATVLEDGGGPAPAKAAGHGSRRSG
ncbi:beta-ketoacyl synthase N-terminal-like domain-containing protein [Streptomonospora nanhaiensis]|uniref:Acyl transferase domain-containing protein n=1 Tax=Streptomonospora nanhaiensis TaxID=1323731 RepID=A0A853BKW1_9ACTN|nr:type I polyketide synthase [Streptomonospora nanhaiensis]MBV2367211.1 type I polyketide synthase [Streptomonospora nanhaiensis]MBX9391133.1 type I polyketide synthase [Streptomonospora nanhaiensis]NYI95186.1 acyl transferase domain-containing protein [Streptomonospora nanhaiensis]